MTQSDQDPRLNGMKTSHSTPPDREALQELAQDLTQDALQDLPQDLLQELIQPVPGQSPKSPIDYALWLKRSLLVLLPGLAVLSVMGMVLDKQQRQAQQAASATAPTLPAAAASPPAALPPALQGKPQAPGAKPGAATKSAAQQPKPSPSPTAPQAIPLGPDGRPQYTPQEQALNQQAKARFQAARSVDAFVEMKVAIANTPGSVTIAASAGAQVVDPSGRAIGSLPPGQAVVASGGGADVQVGGLQGTVLQVVPTGQGILYLNNRPYHGSFTLASAKGKLWVVNQVNLRQYLFSVVGSEVSPSWPMHALKAQSVAARSYALTYYFKPVSSLYHMGSDEYYQVYSGIEKEADTTRQAVDATAGEFVSYRGGIVESLYAASDDIVAEAFQGKGMSQLGALSLAEKGVTYQQILANYYPGTGVGRIELDY